MNVAVILAGGVGSRVGAGCPKQFIDIFGKPVLAYTIENFQNHKQIDAIEVVCLKEYQQYLQEIVNQNGYSKVKWITDGGVDFQQSVLNGINNLKGKLEKEDIILVHYGASPFVSEEIITDAIAVCKEKGNCTSGTPCYLLTGSNDDGEKSTTWVDRDKIMQLNSPQCFKFGYVIKIYEEAIEKDLLGKVEPHTTSLMYELGHTIYFSKGNQTNIKITTKEDVELFKAYVYYKENYKKENE